MLLHTSSFAQRFFYTQVLLHRHTLTHTGRSFTHKYSCTVSFLDTGAFSHMHTRMLFHRDVFIRACLYTEVFSHKGTFMQRFSCTEMLSHTRTRFYTHILVHTNSARKSSASRCKTRISPFDLGAFCAKGFCERKQHVNFTVFFHRTVISPQFWRSKHWRATQNCIFGSFRGSRRISWERVGPAQTHIATLPQFLRIGISFERVAFRGHQSTLPCSPQRKLSFFLKL